MPSSRQKLDGSLPTAFDQNWKPKAVSSSLTGNCQVAILWLRFYKITNKKEYLNAAIKALRFVAGVQDLFSNNRIFGERSWDLIQYMEITKD